MLKNSLLCNELNYCTSKLLRIMNLLSFFLFVTTMQIIASNSYSQDVNIKLPFKSGTVSEIFEAVENQTDYRIFYKSNQLDVTKHVSLEKSEATVSSILSETFKNSPLTYVVVNKVIVITPVENLQQPKIIGTVTDATTGDPLPGVNITIKGTTKGTVTDANGKYTIELSSGSDVLEFSFVGYNTENINVSGLSVVDIKLVPDIKALEEVVVVGYGTQIRREVTGSIASVKADELQHSVVPSFESALQGRATGVQITQSNGSPGSTVLVRVRGIGSISGNTSPLYVVDGVPIISGSYNNPQGVGFESEANVMADLNPADIESIEILKDASASAIYGARAGNGVVLITTKKGKVGKTKINASYYTGVSEETNRVKFLNGRQWLDIVQEGWVNDGKTGMAPLPLIYAGYDSTVAYNTNVDYIDKIMRKGTVQDYNLSASGGNERTTFYVGGGYRNEKGILINNDWERYSGKMSIENKVSQQILVGGNFSMSYINNSRLSGGYESISGVTSALGGFKSAVNYGIPVLPIYELDGSGEYFNAKGFQGNVLAGSDRNLNDFRQQVYRTLGNVYTQISILPTLKFRSEFGVDNLTQMDNNFQSKKVRTNNLSKAEDHRLLVTSYNANNTLTFSKDFENKHSVTLMAGMSFQRAISSRNGLGRENFPSDYLKAPSSASVMLFSYADKSEFAFVSYFSRLNYAYKGRYLLGVSFRTDGSSRFGENRKFGQFPSVSGGWIMTDEEFMKSIHFLNFLKVKTSYGQTGNAEIGDFQSMGLYRTGFNYNNFPGTMPDRIPNPDLRWEKQNMFDAGLEFGFLENRISGSFTFYDKISKDMLLSFPGPQSAGLQTLNVTLNAGSLRNRGIEFSITSNNLNGKFIWTTDINVSHNRSKVLDLAGLKPDQVTGDANYIQTFEGKRLGTFMLIKSLGVDPNTGLEMVDSAGIAVPMKRLEKDQNAALAQRKPLYDKPAEPVLYGGINNTFSYKGFDLNVLFTFSYGNYILDIGERNAMELDNSTLRNYRSEILNRWQKPGDVTDVPKVQYYGPANRDRFYTTRWLHDASYVRLKTLTVGYTIPQHICQKIKVSTLRIYVMGQNLLTFTKFPGWDPEVASVSMKTDQGSYQGNNLSYATANNSIPQIRTITAGINLTF